VAQGWHLPESQRASGLLYLKGDTPYSLPPTFKNKFFTIRSTAGFNIRLVVKAIAGRLTVLKHLSSSALPNGFKRFVTSLVKRRNRITHAMQSFSSKVC